MNNYFYVDERTNGDGFLIRLDFSKFPNIYTTGSYNVLPAHLLGISYANYCRLCRDNFGAKVIGKNQLYPLVIFTSKAAALKVISFLNERIEKGVKE